MRKLIVTLVLTLGVAGLATAQENKGNEQKTERIRLVKGGESQAPATTKKSETPAQELKRCEAQLEALDQKEAWIRNNPKELEVALDSGWFEDAEKTRRTLKNRILELKK